MVGGDPQLTVGSEVEVTSDEDGFKGAWYEATILEPISKSSAKKKKKVLVQYKNLVTEDGSELLKEHVDPAHVRPLPPPDLNPSFEVDDAIDAFYQDGWWSGVVLKALSSSKFMIFHDNPPDIIEAECSNLRRHLEWVHGKWVPSKKQKPTTGSIFSPGTAVEVNIQKDDSRGAWFPATFIKEIDENIFLVKHLSSEDDIGGVFPDELLAPKLAVDSQHIRPTPPLYVKRSYELLEKVEAFYDFAWRAGLITKLLGEGRYLVFFKHANKDKEFSQSEVRPPVDWIDGKWVTDSKEVLITSDCQENLGNDSNNCDVQEVVIQLGSSGSAIDQCEKKKKHVKNSRKYSMELPTPSTESSLSNDSTPNTKKLKLATPKASATDLQPSKKLVSKMEEAPFSVTVCKVRKMVGKTPSKEAGSPTVETGSRSVKQSSIGDQLSARTKCPRKKQFKIRQMNSESNDTGRRLKQPSIKYPRTSVAEVVIGLESPAMKGSDNENHGPPADDTLPGSTPQRSPKKLLTDPSGNKSNKSTVTKLRSVGGSSKKRKRGRPRKLVISPRDNKNNGVVGINDDMAEKECHTVYKDCLDAAVQEAGEVAGTICSPKEVKDASARTTESIVDDDLPLSTWFGGSCKQVEESCKEVNEPSKQADELDKEIHESGKQVNKPQKEANESRLSSGREETTEAPVDSPAVNTNSISVDGENQRLPFVKSSPVWKAIESMEVFHMMPQKPHFSPLGECKEECREGSAIGNMITFANLAEKTSKLQFDDPRSAFESILETLPQLEKHGFEIKALQARVNELLSIKSSGQQHQEESKEVDIKILQHEDERNQYAGEMDKIMEKIRELQEKHAMIKSKHDSVDTELVMLQARSEIIRKSHQEAQIDFKKVAAAPWKSE